MSLCHVMDAITSSAAPVNCLRTTRTDRLEPLRTLNGRMTVAWTQRALLLLLCVAVRVISTPMGSIIEGSVPRCSREGEEISVPGISTDPCITCQCVRAEIRCKQRTCPSNEGCYLIPREKPDDQCCRLCKGCDYRGRQIQSGQSISDSGDPCRILTCEAGVLTISRRHCHVTCKNPRLLHGECCPVCQGCHVDGVTYREGQTFQSPLDQCTTCQCRNGATSCQKEICPVLNCPESQQTTPNGSCCAICRGKREIYMPSRGRCMFKDTVYTNRSDVIDDGCTKCSCVSGTVLCERMTCPLLFCDADHVVLEPGACCPKCASKKRRCKLYGKKHKHGSVWKQDVCTHCYCEDGVSRCHTESCNNWLECPNNTRLKKQDGHCCPQCIDDGALCTVFGDPHYRSFDGRIFNFQGTCDYVLAQTCDSSEISVVVRNDPRLTHLYAWTKTVRIRVAGINVYFLQKNRVKVEKKRVSLPYVYKASVFSIVSVGRSVALKTGSGIKVTWDGDSYLEVFVPPELKNRMCGLCGNYNNDKSDDFLGPGGLLYLDEDEFGRSWLASAKRCQGGNSTGTGGHKKAPCLFQPERRGLAEQQCQDLRKPEFELCRQISDVHSYYTSCMTDVCECPENKQCFCESYLAFTSACAQEGLDLHHELPNTCKAIDCPKGAYWSECADPCPQTCDNHGATYWCDTKLCEPGCQCPQNRVLHDDKCVKPRRCPSSNHDNGTTHTDSSSALTTTNPPRKRKRKKRKRNKLPFKQLSENGFP